MKFLNWKGLKSEPDAEIGENSVKYNLTESGFLHPYTLNELLTEPETALEWIITFESVLEAKKTIC